VGVAAGGGPRCDAWPRWNRYPDGRVLAVCQKIARIMAVGVIRSSSTRFVEVLNLARVF